MPELPRRSDEDMNAHAREGEANCQANAYLELARLAGQEGHPVAAREWLDAARSAIHVANAIHAMRALSARLTAIEERLNG